VKYRADDRAVKAGVVEMIEIPALLLWETAP
jgi:hypothetical protein